MEVFCSLHVHVATLPVILFLKCDVTALSSILVVFYQNHQFLGSLWFYDYRIPWL